MACGTEGKGPYQPSTPACEASEAQLVLPTSPASLSGGGEGCRAAKNSSSSSSLLEGSVEPKIGEEESGTGSGEGRDQTELGPAVPTPRATVPGYRDRRVQICRDIWTQTPRGRWTSQAEIYTDMATCISGASSPPDPLGTPDGPSCAAPNPSVFSLDSTLL